MRFVLKQAGCGSERVGCLSTFAKLAGATIETPTSALFTQGASVVHLTTDVLSRVFSSPQLLWVPLANSIQLETGIKAQGEGIGKFASVPQHVTCVTMYNINEVPPQGHFEYDKLPLWTKNGKKMMTANQYMDVMETFKPDLIIAIADGRTTLKEGIKRIQKSVQRSCSMLDICVERYKDSKQLQNSSLIGVIVGCGDNKKLSESIRHILQYKDDLNGIVLAGITDGTEESMAVPIEKLEEIFKKVNDELPKDFVRIVEGSWDPAVVLSAVEHGWDMFDGSYPLKLTTAGHALALQLDVNRNSEELCILDLNDIQYAEDFRPILEGCVCLACKRHTRAYIRHLLNTREMLSSVLLNIHNLHHFDQMFVETRRHIAAKTFQEYKRHITQQYEKYKSQIANKNSDKESQINTSTNENVEPLQAKKKVKVSSNVANNVANTLGNNLPNNITNGTVHGTI